MPIHIACESCGSRLKVADEFAGRKVKCPKCGNIIRVVDTAVAPAPRPHSRPAPKEPQDTRPRRRAEELDELETVEDEEAPPEEELPRKPRRKKRRRARKKSFNIPAWAWWIGGVAFLLFMSVVAIVVAAVAGRKQEVVTFAVGFFIMLPISTVILVISMIVSSALAGGMDFGDVRVAIPKAVILLFVVDAVGLLPYGRYVAFLIWVFGLMLLFDLDLWETRFLVMINWVLNTLVIWFLLAAMHSGMQHGNGDQEDSGPPPAIGRRPASVLARGATGHAEIGALRQAPRPQLDDWTD